MGGQEENNAVTLKEINSNEKSLAGRNRPLDICYVNGSIAILSHSHGK